MGEWKDVKDFEGIYQVNSKGEVRSIRFKRKRILKTGINNSGYVQVTLSKDGKDYKKLIHRLVAEAFLTNNDNLPCVNHKDENKENNNVENLEWCSVGYNNTYNKKQLRRSKPIVGIDIKSGLILEFESFQEATRKSGGFFDYSHIRKCCMGLKEHKTHKGFKWFYKG